VKEGEEEEQQVLLMAQLCPAIDEPEHIGGRIFLNEEHAKVRLGDERKLVDVPWYLDSGASNHMTCSCSVFADLDT
jgi:hypothetical protein